MTDAADYKEEFKYVNWLMNHSLYYAAIEQCQALTDSTDPRIQAEAYDRIGICYMELGMNDEALKWFLQATSLTPHMPIASAVTYQVHLAILYDHLTEFDRAQRILIPLKREAHELPIETEGLIYANLAVSFYRNGLYAQAIGSTLRCTTEFHKANIHRYDGALYHNLGCYYFELDDMAQARHFLEQSEKASPNRLANMVELARVELKLGNLEQTLIHIHHALNLAYKSIIQSGKEDLAKICQVGGQLAHFLGEPTLGERMLEKAKIYYGEAGFWTEWERMDRDSQRKTPRETYIDCPSNHPATGRFLDEINRFLTFLDMMSAQELLGVAYRYWFDCRVLVAEELARELTVDKESSRALVYACRLADFGLTALEETVLNDPHRSSSAWSQYRMHPELSLRMVDWMKLPDSTFTVIAQHHERYDGLGFPGALPAQELHPLSHVIVVADEYARRVTLDHQTHSQAVRAILRERGQAFHPEIVNAFERLFLKHV